MKNLQLLPLFFILSNFSQAQAFEDCPDSAITVCSWNIRDLGKSKDQKEIS